MVNMVLLSGGSGKRLWPLSNDVRSKQFLKILQDSEGRRISMVQRLVSQIKDVNVSTSITFSTNIKQEEIIRRQLGSNVDIVAEPERRDTFPAIVLSAMYLLLEKKLSKEDIVVVMPSDSFVDKEYFHVISEMQKNVQNGLSEIALMGIVPTCASEKFGYIVPKVGLSNRVDFFVEKPQKSYAEELLKKGALWNGGVFAFRLGFLESIAKKYIDFNCFQDVYSQYALLPKISFDYEVVEKCSSISVVAYDGIWKDLGTWDTLVDSLGTSTIGKVKLSSSAQNTSVVNELDIPIVCLGTKDLVVAASSDGILVSDKAISVNVKSEVADLEEEVMYEEFSWGVRKTLTKSISNKSNKIIVSEIEMENGSFDLDLSRNHENVSWDIISGTGLLCTEEQDTPLFEGIHIDCPKKKLKVKDSKSLKFIEIRYIFM